MSSLVYSQKTTQSPVEINNPHVEHIYLCRYVYMWKFFSEVGTYLNIPINHNVEIDQQKEWNDTIHQESGRDIVILDVVGVLSDGFNFKVSHCNVTNVGINNPGLKKLGNVKDYRAQCDRNDKLQNSFYTHPNVIHGLKNEQKHIFVLQLSLNNLHYIQYQFTV